MKTISSVAKRMYGTPAASPSSDSINITYGGPTLKPQTRYFWLVRVWDKKGGSSVSAPAWFETGLLSPSDWIAKWIRRSDPAADQELAAVRWLWLPGADAQKVVAGTTAEFRYTLHLEAAPMRASLHIVSPGDYVATVNGVVTGHHASWGAFDWEEIGPLLKPGDNEILVKVVAQTKASAPTVATAFAASLRITAQDGTERRVPSDATWLARINDTAQWQPAQVIGPITTPLSIGTDRHSEVPGPNRIATDASLLRKDFELPSAIQSARLTITAIGAYQAFLNGKPVAPQNLLDPGFTDFHKRVLYQTYDVTSMLTTGDNTIAAVLGGGWHGSPMTWAGTREYPEPRRPPRTTRHHPRRRLAQDRRYRRNLANRRRPHPLLRDLRWRGLRRAPRVPRLELPALHPRQRLDRPRHQERLF